ncbi:MAG: 8-amino-7-oxononanoate synthase [Candidatus Levybacteria bacterium RIFCSPHIGHO2_01_FULL_37_17]|nr:MAG: 8-amino-7-oxononanoate synthase [Candidatus Levybacteria bacterium RIFCSPHIGHO2_01_FULL_37_17]OGH37116.1 MAG: 8-amino-7-oxononanoate synthase [Candidatus Levybacteria bacterium RIFCSPLOWO2_01_FULL_38_23]
MPQVDDFYKKLEKASASYKSARIIESGEGAYLTIDGNEVLNLCSSHYLGLAVNPRLVKAAADASQKYGIGTGYRTLAGNHKLHLELEDSLATFKNAEASIVLTGGYMANCAAIQTIVGKEDIVISDELNHASIIDAIRLSQVKNKLIYEHKNLSSLEEKLKEADNLRKTPNSDGEKPLILVVTDGVFSMDGDLAPLPQIVQLAKKYDVLTMVDDAHGEGVLGEGGRGVVDHFKLHGQIDIEVGTLSKAFSVIGGFITGKKLLIDYYKQKARQYLFSNALTISDTAALIEAVRILSESDELVKKLWENAKYLKVEFKNAGFDTGHSETPITPVMIGDEDKAREFSRMLFEEGVFATPIVFPMVAKGKARVRVIPSASHSRQDLNKGISAFVKIGKQLKLI